MQDIYNYGDQIIDENEMLLLDCIFRQIINANHIPLVSRREGKKIVSNGKAKWTLLHFAVNNGAENCIRSLLENGANIDAEDAFGKKPLSYSQNLKFKVQELLTPRAPPELSPSRSQKIAFPDHPLFIKVQIALTSFHLKCPQILTYELLGFLSLKSVYDSEGGIDFITPTRTLENAWRSLLLEIQLYRAVCAGIGSGCFIHYVQNKDQVVIEKGLRNLKDLLVLENVLQPSEDKGYYINTYFDERFWVDEQHPPKSVLGAFFSRMIIERPLQPQVSGALKGKSNNSKGKHSKNTKGKQLEGFNEPSFHDQASEPRITNHQANTYRIKEYRSADQHHKDRRAYSQHHSGQHIHEPPLSRNRRAQNWGTSHKHRNQSLRPPSVIDYPVRTQIVKSQINLSYEEAFEFVQNSIDDLEKVQQALGRKVIDRKTALQRAMEMEDEMDKYDIPHELKEEFQIKLDNIFRFEGHNDLALL